MEYAGVFAGHETFLLVQNLSHTQGFPAKLQNVFIHILKKNLKLKWRFRFRI